MKSKIRGNSSALSNGGPVRTNEFGVAAAFMGLEIKALKKEPRTNVTTSSVVSNQTPPMRKRTSGETGGVFNLGRKVRTVFSGTEKEILFMNRRGI
jgi:hypothetical protein